VLSQAGAEPKMDGWRIYLHTWQAVITPARQLLRTDTRHFDFTLTLKPSKPPVLHGNAGYSRKGQGPERASCYYSFTRLQAKGTLELDGIRHRVNGSAWMDHEFSTAPLQPGIVGWDWFGLQFSDDTEIMFYRLRSADEGVNAASSGTYVLPSGKARHLREDEIRITPTAYWASPHTGGRYPVKWTLEIPSLHCKLTVTADLADQEMRTPRSTGVVYWEGSVKIEGIKAKKRVQGVGYVELTGYAKPFTMGLDGRGRRRRGKRAGPCPNISGQGRPLRTLPFLGSKLIVNASDSANEGRNGFRIDAHIEYRGVLRCQYVLNQLACELIRPVNPNAPCTEPLRHSCKIHTLEA
jgi:hypothetical protein